MSKPHLRLHYYPCGAAGPRWWAEYGNERTLLETSPWDAVQVARIRWWPRPDTAADPALAE